MGYSIYATTDNCYKGTTCLINKFNVKDEKQLAEIEASITFAKSSELERQPIMGNFDFAHYKAIHKYLFEDIYEWAGQIRTANISKKGTRFVEAAEIQTVADACFGYLKKQNYFKDLNKKDFCEEIVEFYCTTNMLHPFREGNGRTQRLFLAQLIRNAGYDIDFSEIDTDELMIATVHAANGVTDYLKDLFEKAITVQNR